MSNDNVRCTMKNHQTGISASGQDGVIRTGFLFLTEMDKIYNIMIFKKLYTRQQRQ